MVSALGHRGGRGRRRTGLERQGEEEGEWGAAEEEWGVGSSRSEPKGVGEDQGQLDGPMSWGQVEVAESHRIMPHN